MEIKEVQRLRDAMSVCKSAISTSNILGDASQIAFTKKYLIAFNEMMIARYPMQFDFEAMTDGVIFESFLSKLKNDIPLEMKIKENELLCKQKRTRAGFPVSALALELYDRFEDIDFDWIKLGDKFISLLLKAKENCSRDMTRMNLRAVNFKSDGVIQATDGFRLFQANIGQKLADFDFLITADILDRLLVLELTHIYVVKEWAYFKTADNAILSVKLYDAEFVDFTPFLNNEGPKVKIPSSLTVTLEKAMVFSKTLKFDPLVNLYFNNNRLKVSIETDNGWFQEELNVKYNFDPLEMQINPNFLMAVLQEVNIMVIGNNFISFKTDHWYYGSAALIE